MPEAKRFRFYDMYGLAKGLEDMDDFIDAYEVAKNFECEIYDTKLKMFALRIIDCHFTVDHDWVQASLKQYA